MAVAERVVTYLFCVSCLSFMFLHRNVLNIAITEMVHEERLEDLKKVVPVDRCPVEYSDQPLKVDPVRFKPHKDADKFYWSKMQLNMVGSSFFTGYVVMQVPAGVLADRAGGKNPLSGALILSSLFSILTPMCTRVSGHWGLLIVRFLLGMGQGLMYPSVSSMVAKWAPVGERGRAGAIVYGGAHFGNIIAYSLSGVVLSTFNRSWDALFYIYGAVVLLLVYFWGSYVYGAPNEHPSLSDSEAILLQDYWFKSDIYEERLPPIPWRSILTSRPLWCLIVCQWGHDLGLIIISEDLPTYMQDVLHFSLVKAGVLTALPFLTMVVTAMLSGWWVDSIVRKDLIPTTLNRKVFSSISSVVPAIGLVGATLAECNGVLVVMCFILGMSAMGCYFSSLKMNVCDLSPNYAGTTMGLVNGVCCTTGIFLSYAISLIAPDDTIHQWRVVFMLAAALMFVTNLVYVWGATAELQPWNAPPRSFRQTLSVSQNRSDLKRFTSTESRTLQY